MRARWTIEGPIEMIPYRISRERYQQCIDETAQALIDYFCQLAQKRNLTSGLSSPGPQPSA